MNLSNVIASLATGTYTVTRWAADSYDTNGVLVKGATSTLSVLACVQPLTGRDLQRLPEGRRTREGKAVYTATALRVEPVADRISIDGETYEVESVRVWYDSGAYYRAVALKVNT